MSDSTIDLPAHLQQQRFRLRPWIRTRLWAQVLAGMVAGFGVGLLLGPDTGWLSPRSAEIAGAWLALPGQIFLGLIAMVLVPLIFASIVGGLTSAGGGELKSIGLRLVGFILLSTIAAAWIGVGLAELIRPGAQMADTLSAPPAATAKAVFDPARAPDIIAGLLSINPTAAIASGDLLAVVVLALVVGLAAGQVDPQRVAPFLKLLQALLSIAMVVVKWAMFLAPLAVFGLMAQLVMRGGLETLAGLSAYVGTVLLGLGLLMALYLLLVALGGGVGPLRFLREAGGTLLLAFSTSSSSAIMPMTLATAKRLGVPDAVSDLVVPLGATMNMAGTALYQSVAVLFLAQMGGVELDLGQVLLVTATLVAASIGAPGTPGVSIAILMSVAGGFGIPLEGMALILGVDRLLDMSRTTVNVTGDLVACLFLRRIPARVQAAAA